MTSTANLVADRVEVAHDAATAAFASAAARHGARAKTYNVAGLTFRVDYVGDILERLAPGLEHLEGDAASPGLVIRAFDGASTGSANPFDAEAVQALIVAGSPGAPQSPRFRASYRRPDSGVGILDLSAASALYWVADAARIPPWEQAAPFRGILSAWAGTKGRRYVHGAAIGADGRAALIVGPGGSGKSTTALTCFAAGMDYAGDDYCIVDTAAGKVFALYRSAKLHPTNVERVPWLAGRALNEGDTADKLVYFPAPDAGGALVPEMRVAAIVMPRIVAAGPSRLVPASAAEALAAIAPTTLLQLTHASAEALSDLAKLARSAPAYRLELGDDTARLPDLLRGLLAQ